MHDGQWALFNSICYKHSEDGLPNPLRTFDFYVIKLDHSAPKKFSKNT